jgi:hypothetical protein
MAITGHKPVSEVSRYTKAADQSRAEQARVKLRTKQDENGPAPRIRWTKDAVCWVATPAEVSGVRTLNNLASQTLVTVALGFKGPIGEVTNLVHPPATSVAIPTTTDAPRREKKGPGTVRAAPGRESVTCHDDTGERFTGK